MAGQKRDLEESKKYTYLACLTIKYSNEDLSHNKTKMYNLDVLLTKVGKCRN